ncbi:MAG: type II toxin-antitoxin system RelE/ParE family toxin [Cyanobacteria bacterium SBLK]|nr:type II toxin-antitoxin system RelE/ParE family toxin [Cyanobacteria bacterium SBLK]
MTYQVLLSPEAEIDLEDAYNWYEEQNAGLGSEFIRVIDASLSAIQRNPFAYALVFQQERQVRRKLIRKFPYSVFYCVEDAIIVIVACFHVKRDPQEWQKRL